MHCSPAHQKKTKKQKKPKKKTVNHHCQVASLEWKSVSTVLVPMLYKISIDNKSYYNWYANEPKEAHKLMLHGKKFCRKVAHGKSLLVGSK